MELFFILNIKENSKNIILHFLLKSFLLKYFILKVDPKKKMLFNPKESIDFNGNTGPFIQYTYARIQSLLAKAEYQEQKISDYEINDSEKDLMMNIFNFKDVVSKAAESLSPALVANYIYELVKSYNSFFVFITPSKEPNPSRWALPTFVINP